MVSGVLEKGWWLGGLVVGGSGGSGYIGGGQGNWETGTWTNVDNILMVQKRAAGVVWCGDGEYQFEIHERTTGRAAGCTRRAKRRVRKRGQRAGERRGGHGWGVARTRCRWARIA